MTTKTVEQVKAEYRAKGIPIAQVAREQGWTPQEVYKVFNGQARTLRAFARHCGIFWLKTGRNTCLKYWYILAQNRTFYHFNPLFYKVLGKKDYG